MKVCMLVLIMLLQCDFCFNRSSQKEDSDFYMQCIDASYHEGESEFDFDGTQGELSFDILFVNRGENTLDFKIQNSNEDYKADSKIILVDINKDTIRGYVDNSFSRFSIAPEKKWSCIMYIDDNDAKKNLESHIDQFDNIRFYKKMLALNSEIYYVKNNEFIKIYKTIVDIDRKYFNSK